MVRKEVKQAMSYTFKSDLTKEEYLSYAANSPLYNIFQSPEWREVKKEWHSYLCGVYEDDHLVATALALVRDLPLGMKMFYLPRGPLLDFNNQELLAFFTKEMKKFARSKGGIILRMDPNVLLSSLPIKEARESEGVRQSAVIDALKKCGYKHFGFNKDMYATAQPRYCGVLYYGENWEENYHPKAFKEIRKAKGKGVELEILKRDQLDVFAHIMSYTEKRKNIMLRNQEYYERLYDAYPEDIYVCATKLNIRQQLINFKEEAAQLEEGLKNASSNKNSQKKDQLQSILKQIDFLNEAQKEDGDEVYISCLLGIKVGSTAELLYAGMNEKYNKYYATYVSYYSGIRWAYDNGCRLCNFGGLEGTLDDGLTIFKSYFDPNIDEYIGEFDLPINPLMYWAFIKGVPLYKDIRTWIRTRRNK